MRCVVERKISDVAALPPGPVVLYKLYSALGRLGRLCRFFEKVFSKTGDIVTPPFDE